jgi:superfamily II DNA or RNA helicase/very-short-patch-repair endonuclease
MAADFAHLTLPASSFLESCFLRWVLAPATTSAIIDHITAQAEVNVGERHYRIDYEIVGERLLLAVELDGYALHSDRVQFTYDRFRQNDLHGSGRTVVRFSYDSIRFETARCVDQLQHLLSHDPLLARFVIEHPTVPPPDDMDADPLLAIARPASLTMTTGYFDLARQKVNRRTLRDCQSEAFEALANYYVKGGDDAATVMAVGAGKTALGVVACLGFARRRAMIITPGSVIRGTFDRALDHRHSQNVLYGLPDGALIPGCPPPAVRVLDRDDGPIRNVARDDLLAADILVTNFHSLGTGEDPDDLLAKLRPNDIDFIVVDEAHIAAAESYQRTFRHFEDARTLLMSACFQRLDGRPIDADVVYRYRLIDSIVDGNAKQLRVRRFAPRSELTTYEIVWPDGAREEIVGREALLGIITDERKLARITAKSTEPIRQVMRSVRATLDRQAELFNPIKPRVLFAALGHRHAEQIARIATEHGIPSASLHHTMTDRQIRDVRERFESDAGDLQGIVQLRMLGQGYDFPPICVVAPMRPYGSFSEFYQFIGRGIRVIRHPALEGRVPPSEQWLDVIYHAELGLDRHIDTIYAENDMDPLTEHEIPDDWGDEVSDCGELGGTTGTDVAGRPMAFVMFERGDVEQRVVHNEERVQARKAERERHALARKYAEYAQGTDNPVTFDQYVEVMRQLTQ